MKILVIGCGSIGQRHIRNLIFLKAGDIFAFDIDKAKLEAVKKISPFIAVSEDLGSLWKEKPDIVFVTVPTALHIKYALSAANRGCHIFVEKPLSHNRDGVNELLKIATDKRLIIFVGYNLRFNKCLLKVKAILDKKAIGKIITARTHFGSYLPERHPWEDYRRGYGARKALGGGAILDALSHHLDLAVFLFGKAVELLGYSAKRSDLDIDVEDMANALIKFRNGEIVELHANFVERPYRHTIEIIGDKGVLACDFVNNVVRHYDAKTKKWAVYYGDRDSNKVYIKEMEHFLKCVKGQAKIPVDAIGAKKELELLMKIKESNRRKRWVRV